MTAPGRWIKVEPVIAARTAYYGIGGWLALLLMLYSLAGLVTLFQAVMLMIGGASLRGGGLVVLLGVLLLILGLLLMLVVVKGFSLRRSFVPGICSLLVAYAVMQLAMVPRQQDPALPILASLVGLGLQLAYFARSKRVNATYLHRLKSGDPEAERVLNGGDAPSRDRSESLFQR